MARVTRKLIKYLEDIKKKSKIIKLFKVRKEVEIGKNGTQGYMITKGKNKGTIL
jgi:hypothetical protein